MADMNRITVTQEELESAIRSFISCKERFEEAYNAMNAEMTSINSTWDGIASEAFFNRFSELFNHLRTSEGTMEQSIKGLEFAKEAYARVEEENSQMFENLRDTNPFG